MMELRQRQVGIAKAWFYSHYLHVDELGLEEPGKSPSSTNHA